MTNIRTHLSSVLANAEGIDRDLEILEQEIWELKEDNKEYKKWILNCLACDDWEIDRLPARLQEKIGYWQ